MKGKNILIESMIIVVLLTLVSCSNAVGFQSVVTKQNEDKLKEFKENIYSLLSSLDLPLKPLFVFGILIELFALFTAS